jgi:hypothetical protein
MELSKAVSLLNTSYSRLNTYFNDNLENAKALSTNATVLNYITEALNSELPNNAKGSAIIFASYAAITVHNNIVKNINVPNVLEEHKEILELIFDKAAELTDAGSVDVDALKAELSIVESDNLLQFAADLLAKPTAVEPAPATEEVKADVKTEEVKADAKTEEVKTEEVTAEETEEVKAEEAPKKRTRKRTN